MPEHESHDSHDHNFYYGGAAAGFGLTLLQATPTSTVDFFIKFGLSLVTALICGFVGQWGRDLYTKHFKKSNP